jgi:hypothetical protein
VIPGSGTTTNPCGNDLRPISISGSESLTFDGIGPGLEIEMEVGKFGPIGASLFIGGAAYKILGKRDVSFANSVSFEAGEPVGVLPGGDGLDLGADTYNGDWSYEVDPWLYRARVGLRFQWLGD